MADLSRLEQLGIAADVELMSLAPNDFRSVLKVVAGVQPDEIYNLAGQTSAGLSFEQPVECLESISTATLNLLEVILLLGGRHPLLQYGQFGVLCRYGAGAGHDPAGQSGHLARLGLGALQGPQCCRRFSLPIV
jgi:nucleoside-diphosphate-sugar epimerase